MLDFIKDTDWFITPHYVVRKTNALDPALISSFFDDYLQYACDNTEKAILPNDFDFVCSDEDASNIILRAALIDKRNHGVVAVIGIRQMPDNTIAQARIFLHDQHLSSQVIKELLIWLVDYSFYCLYFKQLMVIPDKYCVDLVTILIMFKFNKVEQLPNVLSGMTNLQIVSYAYSIREYQWFNHDIVDDPSLNPVVADQYLQNIVKPYFQTAISKSLYSTIVDFRYQTILCTDQSARSIGLLIGEDATGTGYKYYARVDLAQWYFGKWYNDKSAYVMHHYARKIFRIQQYVFKTGHPASFIDSLPYDRGIRSYLITFTPVFNDTGSVVAIQSIALNYRLAGYHEYIQNILEQQKVSSDTLQIKLSKREEEVLFLLICGITQEQIADILEVKRETVASIIRNQLRIKFALPMVSTKLVVETALSYGFPFSIPESLWRPSVIILEEKLAAWLKQYHFVL
ncbi:MAG: hypothetical protein EKK54_03755 [Neisseriaceae bacterium]|nr:MAG: hypothetical protein EKK54_03755 [Neisseriaceae bacterium]